MRFSKNKKTLFLIVVLFSTLASKCIAHVLGVKIVNMTNETISLCNIHIDRIPRAKQYIYILSSPATPAVILSGDSQEITWHQSHYSLTGGSEGNIRIDIYKGKQSNCDNNLTNEKILKLAYTMTIVPTKLGLKATTEVKHSYHFPQILDPKYTISDKYKNHHHMLVKIKQN